MNGRHRIDCIAVGSLATVAVLVWSRPPLWPLPADGDDLAVSVAWMVAFVCTVRLTVTACWCALALRRNRPEGARRIARLAPRVVRHAVEIAIVSSVTLSIPVAASAQGRDEPVVRAPVPIATPARADTPAPAPSVARPRTRVVRPGDSLWSIARAELLVPGHVQPTDAQVARYWRALVTANRSTLRSGNPNLIYPGEVVALPPGEPLS